MENSSNNAEAKESKVIENIMPFPQKWLISKEKKRQLSLENEKIAMMVKEYLSRKKLCNAGKENNISSK